MIDNSDYIKKEKELKRERKFLQNVMATIPDSLLILDGELQIKSANHSFYTLFQTKPGMTIGRKIADILGDEDGKLSAKLGGLFGTKDTLENFELHYQSEKLGERIFNITARGIIVAEEEEEEEEELLLVVIHDVTERKRAEEALRQTEENFRRFLDDSPLGIRKVSADGEVLYANRAVLDIYGYDSIEELKTTPRKKSYTPESYAEHQQRKEKRQRGEYVPSNYTISIVRKDGEIRHLEVSRKEVRWNGETQFQVIYQDVTERKQAEETLRESEERYRHLFDNLNDAAFLADVETGMIIETNQQGMTLLGKSHDEIVGMHQSELHPLGKADEYIQKFDTHIQKGHAADYDGEVIRKDGAIVPVRISAATLTIRGQALILGLFRDITERKRAEKKLKESEEKLRLMFESVADGITISDMDGKIVQVNEAVVHMHGYDSKEEFMGISAFELIAEKDHARAMQNMKRTLGDGVTKNLEYTLLRKDGSEFPAMLSATLLREASGNPVSFIAITKDITEYKQAEEALVDEATRRRILVEQSRDGIVILDQGGGVYEANQRFCEMLGYSLKETLQLKVWDWEFQLSLEQVQDMIRNVNETGDNFETQHRRKDGTIYDVEISTNGAIIAGQKLIFCVCRDITERKQVEEERLELEQKAQVASRLASIGEMAAGIAHEINNPLTPILGFADLLLKRDISEDIRADLQVIRDSAKRTADVTRRLLIFARQYKPMRTLCNINEVVETVLQLRDYHLKTNCIKVIIELAPGLPQTMADAGQLQQVMLNLIMNAEYEMSQAHGGGKLLIKTEKKDNIIRVLVKDDGLGISKENMGKLFHPFFTTKAVGEGTGLGLSVCHGIVTEHNGRIYAESKVGEGATFIVELPLVRQEEEEEAKLSEPDTGEAGEAAKARILVVDDEPTIVQVLKQVLTDEGYEVKATGKAKEALRLIEGGKYALILLDIKLPDMSGIELYQHLDKTARSLTQRIIFITGDVMGTDTMDFFSRTGAAYITKPFDIEQLKKEVKSKLTKRG